MASLICGSLAFDTIMDFEGRFAEQILPDQLHILNVSFLVPSLRRDFGGCAGNIAYSLKVLGGTPLPMATLGTDAADYLQRLKTLGISTEYVRQVEGSYTAQAMIMTDRDNNQITAFHPGAMMQAHITQIEKRSDIKLAIISPDGRDAMVQHAEQLKAADIPFVFDPGQGLPMFDGADLNRFIDQATWVTVNDYEGKMLSDRTGLSHADISRRVQGLIVTLGAEGCEVWIDGEKTLVPPVKAAAVVDPTGCGDAWRGALLFGLEQGWSLAKCAALGNQVGALKIAQRGPQNYNVDGLTLA
ncbi:MAG: carbohydrate kinase family protein [Burkholderiales bacterium 35-55-47]|jgi:adenosine kinase|uniref:carbohydrate kinase family protein n=1 Tax=Limnohabitans sp. TaxID=1907725 RepID=UPI000BCA31EC|nr:carbohydrate kinase family protein [Limnohabitans sp.]OYY18185.1 MAG: carbohydrate kinase family protein [Burkholderiales bacterium 35-55-47]OYZ72598.1 MAG: carbohydrate kinase family protein [Burkholderiales bacterium 24-55-52]OZB00051.1 MAG: carbohydrate kinase family protein [Burkholderiales bacterium 39-55-53]HQR87005.1 carbohydrate kinase family protein [Limnohabitans sp.]HQS26897.1 carbohydrate kinase family protein [Limnohabitans sp.]